MPKPIRLFFRSLLQFLRGFGPAFLLAWVCFAIQFGDMLVPDLFPAPVESAEPMKSLEERIFEPKDWRDDVAHVMLYTRGFSGLFFFHALVALIVTAWLLRGPAGFAPLQVLPRALVGAIALTCGAAVVYAGANFLDDVYPATRYVKFDFSAAAMVALWFGGTALILPARLMGHQPSVASGWMKPTLIAAMALVPWFYASEVIGAPIRHCHDCGGFMDGGIFFYPLLGAYLLSLTVSSAAVSAAACMPMEEAPATASA
jgi:hypothetical protein